MRLATVVCFIGMILCCVNSFAENTLKVGYVDVRRTFQVYDEARGEFIKKGGEELTKRQEEIKKLDEKLRGEISTLTDEEKGKRRKDIQEKVEELIKFDRAQQEYINKALNEIYQVVEKIGEKEGFDLIIEQRSIFGKTVILFGKKSLDVTDKVIKELPKK